MRRWPSWVNRRTFARIAGGLAAAGLAVALGLLLMPRETAPCTDAQRKDLARLARRLRGFVVYQRSDDWDACGIYRTAIGSARTVRLADNARYPRCSPDGRWIAFVRGRTVMRMRSNGREQRPLAETARADRVDAVAWHPSGREVLFTDDNEIKAVSIETGAVRMVVRGHQFRGLDLATNGILVATSSGHRMHGFDLNTGQYHDLGRGCSANLSPDGSLMSRNTGRHLSMSLQRWADGAEVGSIAAPPGLTIDNEYWSNHPNWIVTRTESPRRCFVFVHDVAAKRAYQVTFEGNGNRPDLHVTWSRSPPRLSRFGFRR